MWTHKPPIGTLLRTNHWSVEGLVGFWPMLTGAGGELKDMTLGGRNPGTINGATWVAGMDGTALYFDGNDYVSVPDADDLSFGNGVSDYPFTMSAWVKLDNNASQRIINKIDGNSAREYIWGTGGGGALHIRIYDDTSGPWIGTYTTNTLNTNEWIYVLVTYDGSGLKTGFTMYINGVNESVITEEPGEVYTAMHNLGMNVLIGAAKFTAMSYTNGQIDNVAIYNWALSAAQVWELFRNPHIQFEPPMMDAVLAAALGIPMFKVNSGLVNAGFTSGGLVG